jgi:hypothetical protein
MPAGLVAGITYFVIVFGVGFLLGPLRVLILEPRIGATLAVLIETPILIVTMVLAARFLIARLNLAHATVQRIAMGSVALALVIIADLGVGLGLRGITLAEQGRYLITPAGLIYLSTLAVFAAIPVVTGPLVARRARAGDEPSRR